MARNLGIGGGLAGAGMRQQDQAMDLLGAAADQEQGRNMANQQMEQQRQAGNTQLGVTSGAMIGFQAGGPVGALIGGALGAVAGGLL